MMLLRLNSELLLFNDYEKTMTAIMKSTGTRSLTGILGVQIVTDSSIGYWNALSVGFDGALPANGMHCDNSGLRIGAAGLGLV